MSTNQSRNSNTKSKKVPIIIGAVFLLIAAIAVIVFVNTGKPGEENEVGVDNENTANAEIKGSLEYGEDIAEKTFKINNSDGVHEVSFADLTPEIDTMVLGETKHEVELNDEIYDVLVTIEDTVKPTISGVKPVVVIETEDKEVDVEKELTELITAEDPVDGELEVTFEIEQKENRENEYNVTASTEDNNENKTTKTFEVTVTIVEPEVEEDEKEKNKDVATAPSGGDGSYDSGEPNYSGGKSDSSSSNSSSSSSSSSNSSSSSSNSGDSGNSTAPEKKPAAKPQPKPEKKPEKKPEPKPQPKPEKKPEPKPEPKPEVTPKPGPKLPNPKNLPPGASKVKDAGDEVEYNYNRSFGSGGSITTIVVDGIYNTIGMLATDNNGDTFLASYVPSSGNVLFEFGNPKLTQDDVGILYEVGRAFAASYGM